MSSSANFEVECEILSVTPRLLVRLPETANPGAVRAAAAGGVAAWRLVGTDG